MAKRNHLTTVRQLLEGQGLNTPDSQIFEGPAHEDMSDERIIMMETGGEEPGNEFGSTRSIQKPRVQVRVQSKNYKTGKADADQVWQILQDNKGSAYSRTQMLQSSPLYLGVDDDGRHDWSINAELFIYE